MKYELYPPLAIHELGQRANQEDSVYPKLGNATIEDRLFVVCDGMGGHEKGEVASGIVCQSFQRWFAEHISMGEPFSDDQFREALDYVYSQLDAADDGAAKKMGTTLTFLYLHCDGATMAHIGDSRIYHIRPSEGRVLYQSRDHSLVFELFQAGEITYDEMRSSPQKNIITRAMQPGEDNRVRADIVHTIDIRPGDYFYLCTDGMLEEMENEELVSILSANISDEEKQQKLIEATTNNKDNHSAYLIHIKDVICEAGDEAKPNDEASSRYNAVNILKSTEASATEETVPEEDRQEEDDVVVVEDAPTTSERILWDYVNPSQKVLLRRIKIIAVALALLFSAYAAIKTFIRDKVVKEEVNPDSIIQTPIAPPVQVEVIETQPQKDNTVQQTEEKVNENEKSMNKEDVEKPTNEKREVDPTVKEAIKNFGKKGNGKQ